MKSLARSLLLALALTTGAWVPVQAQTFEQSLAAYERKDYRTAFAGFKKLAEQGVASAQNKLGLMYDGGQGVPKNDQQAVAWYRKAAEQGYAEAQHNLGQMYAFGQGVPKDEQSAYFWWLLASAQGVQDAVKNRDIAERYLSPEQRAAARAAARNWKPKTAAASEQFIVQLAALSDANKAQELKARAAKAGLPAFTDKAGLLTRVRVGPYTSRAAAVAAAVKLAEHNMAGQVLTQ